MAMTPEEARSWLVENGELTVDEARSVTANEATRRAAADRVKADLQALDALRRRRETR